MFIQSLFYLGAFTTVYYMSNFSYLFYTYLINKTRSLFNANKYLLSNNSDSNTHKKYYAVIYGVANRPGTAFAKFLAQKGFNLILIERDI